MPWVAIAVNISSDPAVHRMASSLNVRVPEVVGLLALTFAKMVEQTPDGQIADVPDTLLEQWAVWGGKRGKFAAQFRAELCDPQGLVRSWEKYNGANLRRLEGARERARLWREKQERERNERAQNENGTPQSTRTVRIPYTSTEQNRTEPSTTKALGADAPAVPEKPVRKPPPSPPRSAVVIAEHWQSVIGATTPSRVQRALGGAVATYGESVIILAIDAYAAAQLEKGKARKLEWFAEDVAGWVTRARMVEPPLTENGWLSSYGEKVTRP